MSRYIEAETLKLSILRYAKTFLSHKRLPITKSITKSVMEEVIHDVCFAIDARSTADVAPVVHGHWMKQRVSYFHELLDYTAKCSICLNVPDENMTYDGIKIMWKYCPVCGAKMDEVTE